MAEMQSELGNCGCYSRTSKDNVVHVWGDVHYFYPMAMAWISSGICTQIRKGLRSRHRGKGIELCPRSEQGTSHSLVVALPSPLDGNQDQLTGDLLALP